MSADGSSCNDAEPCTENDVCMLGVCLRQNTCECTSDEDCAVGNNPCAVVSCEESACVFSSAPVGTECNDGQACTTNDACNAAGFCAGVALDCSSLDADCAIGFCEEGICKAEFKPTNVPCRESIDAGACDPVEYGTGRDAQCPTNEDNWCTATTQATTLSKWTT